MKKIIAIFAMVCVIAAAGCSGAPQTTTSGADTSAEAPASTTAPAENGETTTGKKVTQVYKAPEKEDTTEDALKYLEQNAPLYYNYIKMRRSTPLTIETTIDNNGVTGEMSYYIKDKDNFVEYVKNPDGSTIKVVYKDDMIYQIESADKVVYEYQNKDYVDQKSEAIRLAIIYLDSAMESSYTTDTAEYNGKEYDRVTITDSYGKAEHYFDKTTGKIEYSISGSVVSKITKFENSVDESVFDIPTDYERKTYDDYKEKLNSEAETTQAAE